MEILRRLDGQLDNVVAGVADADGTPLEVGDPYRIGSISKTFVATMVLQLVDEGKVELDATLDTYLNEVELGGQVTLRQLLSHRSGLPNYTSEPGYGMALTRDLSRWFSPEEVLAFVDPQAAVEPGEFEYSNTNYILLGLVIEAIDERSLAESLQIRIAGPLGLDATVLPTESDVNPVPPVAPWAPGLFDGEPDAPYESLESSAWAAGGVISNSSDLLKFFEALFDGELLTSASLSEMIDLQAPDASDDGYGLGISAFDLGAIKGYGHDGSIPGYGSFVVYDPDTGDALIGLKNNEEIDTFAILANIGDL